MPILSHTVHKRYILSNTNTYERTTSLSFFFLNYSKYALKSCNICHSPHIGGFSHRCTCPRSFLLIRQSILGMDSRSHFQSSRSFRLRASGPHRCNSVSSTRKIDHTSRSWSYTARYIWSYGLDLFACSACRYSGSRRHGPSSRICRYKSQSWSPSCAYVGWDC